MNANRYVTPTTFAHRRCDSSATRDVTITKPLCRAHGDRGIDARSTACGNPTGEDPDHGHHRSDRDQRDGVARRDTEEQTLDHARGEEGSGDAQHQSDGQQDTTFTKDHALHTTAVRPETHTDADLVGARAD